MKQLTAEQVWQAIFDSSIYATYDGVKCYAEGINTQSIADKLNKVFGIDICEMETLERFDGSDPHYRCKECELEIKDNMNETEGTGAVWWECSSCHWQIEFFHTKWLHHAKFCPDCGARIRKVV